MVKKFVSVVGQKEIIHIDSSKECASNECSTSVVAPMCIDNVMYCTPVSIIDPPVLAFSYFCP